MALLIGALANLTILGGFIDQAISQFNLVVFLSSI